MSDKVVGNSKFLLILFVLFPMFTVAQEIVDVGSFSTSTTDAVYPAGWEPLNLGGAEHQTEYTLVEDGGMYVMRAESNNSASALTYPLKIDLKKTPIIQWSWKIDNVIVKGDAMRKDGDDYPARLYIIFDYDASQLSWFEKLEYEAYHLLNGTYPPVAALNYLWANKLPVSSLVPNIYSARVQMFAIRSGGTELGKWVNEERNIFEDYLHAFGEEPPVVAGIAIMTDTDNTGERATTYYGDIRLLSLQPE